MKDYRSLQNELLGNPEKGDLIKHTGGLRKIRVPLFQRGKRGGARAIYYYLPRQSRILFITAYNKNRSEDLTQEQYKILANLIKDIERIEE